MLENGKTISEVSFETGEAEAPSRGGKESLLVNPGQNSLEYFDPGLPLMTSSGQVNPKLSDRMVTNLKAPSEQKL